VQALIGFAQPKDDWREEENIIAASWIDDLGIG